MGRLGVVMPEIRMEGRKDAEDGQKFRLDFG